MSLLLCALEKCQGTADMWVGSPGPSRYEWPYVGSAALQISLSPALQGTLSLQVGGCRTVSTEGRERDPLTWEGSPAGGS